MGRIYKLARYGDLEVEQLRAFIYALREIRETISTGDLEQRLIALEEDRR